MKKDFEPALWIDIDPKKIGNRINRVEVLEQVWLEQSFSDDDKPFVLNYVTNHGVRNIARNYLQCIGLPWGGTILRPVSRHQ